jgi:hypothetical protein
MSHFAKVENGVVTQVIVAEQDVINSGLFGDSASWVQTSYNTRNGVHYMPDSNTPSADQSKALRKNYAGIGYSYDIQRDAFIPPKPHQSWLLNENTCQWQAPVPYPTDGRIYIWDELTVNWVLAPVFVPSVDPIPVVDITPQN